jgi:hypothetical protein
VHTLLTSALDAGDQLHALATLAREKISWFQLDRKVDRNKQKKMLCLSF